VWASHLWGWLARSGFYEGFLMEVWLTVYRKAVVATIGFLAVLAVGLADGKLTAQEIVVSVVAGLTALGVERVENAPY